MQKAISGVQREINNIWVSKSSYLSLLQFFNTIFQEQAPYLHLQEVVPNSLGKDHQNPQFSKVQSFNTTLKRSVPRNATFIGCLWVMPTVQLTLRIMIQAANSKLSALEFVPPFPLVLKSNKAWRKYRKIMSPIIHIAKFQAYKTNRVAKRTKL